MFHALYFEDLNKFKSSHHYLYSALYNTDFQSCFTVLKRQIMMQAELTSAVKQL